MKYTDLIFDLYGTLVDIHTEENDLVWEKTAFFFGFYGAKYTPAELRDAYITELRRREVAEGKSAERVPEIPFDQAMAALFAAKGVENAADLGFRAAQVFRVASLDFVRLYPGVVEALETLRAAGYRLWLLTNAQRAFTAYELRLLDLDKYFDGIYLSSDYRCRKPDRRFFAALLEERNLKIENCLMIGNDRRTDIVGAQNLGMDTFYMHTAQTPGNQEKADPAKLTDEKHREFEGGNWFEILKHLL